MQARPARPDETYNRCMTDSDSERPQMTGLIKRANGSQNVGLGTLARPSAGPDEVVIEVYAVGICGTDLHIQDDEFPSTPPVVMGHEVTGRVIEAGAGAEDWLGQRVSPETYFYTCDRCAACLAGQRNLCPARRSIGSHVNGGFARFVLVPQRNLHAVDASVGEHAGALYEPLSCVAQCLCDPAVASPGDTALVVGPGAMGILSAQVLRAQGATVTISGTSADAQRLDIAASLGFAPVLASELDSAVPGIGFDVVADASGNERGIDAGLRAVRKGGRYVQVGLTGKPISVDIDLVCLKELTVTSGFASTPRSWRRVEQLIGAGLVVLDPLVTDVSPLSAWETSFGRTRRADGLKLMLDPRMDT
jgi:L-iditol 2-dehydrogenase